MICVNWSKVVLNGSTKIKHGTQLPALDYSSRLPAPYIFYCNKINHYKIP